MIQYQISDTSVARLRAWDIEGKVDVLGEQHLGLVNVLTWALGHKDVQLWYQLSGTNGLEGMAVKPCLIEKWYSPQGKIFY